MARSFKRTLRLLSARREMGSSGRRSIKTSCGQSHVVSSGFPKVQVDQASVVPFVTSFCQKQTRGSNSLRAQYLPHLLLTSHRPHQQSDNSDRPLDRVEDKARVPIVWRCRAQTRKQPHQTNTVSRPSDQGSLVTYHSKT